MSRKARKTFQLDDEIISTLRGKVYALEQRLERFVDDMKDCDEAVLLLFEINNLDGIDKYLPDLSLIHI